MKKESLLIIASIIILVSLGGYFLFNPFFLTGKVVTGSAIIETNLDDFAKCLTSNGAKMYGAFWCGYCNKEKDLFGDSFKFIDYIECDAKGENANPLACKEAGVNGYPTWIINKIPYARFQSLESLAKITNCKLNLE